MKNHEPLIKAEKAFRKRRATKCVIGAAILHLPLADFDHRFSISAHIPERAPYFGFWIIVCAVLVLWLDWHAVRQKVLESFVAVFLSLLPLWSLGAVIVEATRRLF